MDLYWEPVIFIFEGIERYELRFTIGVNNIRIVNWKSKAIDEIYTSLT
jgi:hypothetical protein